GHGDLNPVIQNPKWSQGYGRLDILWRRRRLAVTAAIGQKLLIMSVCFWPIAALSHIVSDKAPSTAPASPSYSAGLKTLDAFPTLAPTVLGPGVMTQRNLHTQAANCW